MQTLPSEESRRILDAMGIPVVVLREVSHETTAIRTLYEVTNGEAFICSDVGQHQMFAAQYYKYDQPRRWINSGGLGTMGFGLPAAMGVQLAHPESPVAVVTGEGSIQMVSKNYRLVRNTTCL